MAKGEVCRSLAFSIRTDSSNFQLFKTNKDKAFRQYQKHKHLSQPRYQSRAGHGEIKGAFLNLITTGDSPNHFLQIKPFCGASEQIFSASELHKVNMQITDQIGHQVNTNLVTYTTRYSSSRNEASCRRGQNAKTVYKACPVTARTRRGIADAIKLKSRAIPFNSS